MRRQSFGVATMICLVFNGQVICAYIGDVISEEIIGFGPGSNTVECIFGTRTSDLSKIDRSKPLSTQYVQLRDLPHTYQPIAEAIVSRHGAFKSANVMQGSIAWGMCRLLKGEVGAYVMHHWLRNTPWDNGPMDAIAQKLGMVYLRPNQEGNRLEKFTPVIPDGIVEKDYDIIVVHESHASELLEFRL